MNRFPHPVRARQLAVLLVTCAICVAGFTRTAHAVTAAAEEPIRYRLLLDAPETQMLGMEMRIPALGRDELELVLPTWRPGRYEILEPAGTVREERATAANGPAPTLRKITKNRWRLDGVGGRAITVHYRVYANSISDRTRHVDDSHAFLSPSSCFMYVDGERARAIEVVAITPQGWRMSTGLPQMPGRRGDPTLPALARDYDELVDSPFEIGRQAVLEFEVADALHEIVIWPPDVERDDERLIADFRAIVESTLEIFGTLPYERYVFMLHVGAGGGGTEHLNSTIMQTSRAALRGSADRDRAYRGLLGLTAHEFFHTWNVKQFRPAGLKPYDYERENYTDLLWVAEGTTSYYDEVLPVRAGIVDVDRLLDGLAGQVRSTRSRPGRLIQSVAASSFDAWVKFNRRTPDHVNCTVSFYTKGSLASFLLDLEIRRRTEGRRDLDDVMALLFERFPLEARGFTTEDLQDVLETLTGDRFDGFLERYVHGVETLPLEEAVRTLGLELVSEPVDDGAPPAGTDADGDGVRDRVYVGLDLRDENGRAVVRAVRSDGVAYRMGLNAGDEIVAIDGRRVSAGTLQDVLDRAWTQSSAARRAAEEAGDPIPDGRLQVTYFRRDRLREVRLLPDLRPAVRWELRRRDDATLAEKAAYVDWCGQAWPGTEPGATGENAAD